MAGSTYDPRLCIYLHLTQRVTTAGAGAGAVIYSASNTLFHSMAIGIAIKSVFMFIFSCVHNCIFLPDKTCIMARIQLSVVLHDAIQTVPYRF